MAASIKRIGELKRQVYRDFACGLALGDDIPDRDAPYWSIASNFSGERPASAEAQALAFLRLLQEEGIEGWIYRFGVPDLFVHCGVIARSDRGPVFFDAFTGLGFAEPLTAVLDKLDRGDAPKVEALGKDRKVCVVDVAADPDAVVQQLSDQADRELVGSSGQRAFLMAWTPELYAECSHDLAQALEVVADAEGTASFDALLLYPVAVVDGGKVNTEIADMPVIGPWFAARDNAAASARAGALRTARPGEGRMERIEMARAASMNRLIQDLQRDVERLRQERREVDVRDGVSPMERTSLSRSPAARIAGYQADAADHRAELEAAQRQIELSEVSAKRLQAEHARLLEQSMQDHALTQDALRKAADDLRAGRGQLLDLQSELDRARHQAERSSREAANALQQLDEERSRAAAQVADLRRHLEEAVADERAKASKLGDDLNRRLDEAGAECARLAKDVERREHLAREHDDLAQRLEQETRRREQAARQLEEASGQIERLERRLEQLQAAGEDAEHDAQAHVQRIETLTRELEAAKLRQEEEFEATKQRHEEEFEAAKQRHEEEFEAGKQRHEEEFEAAKQRHEEERKLMQVAQARLERELQTASGMLNAREGELQSLAHTIVRLAYTPSQGQPVVAPDLGIDARIQAAKRVEQRIIELEHARASAEAELENHRTMLANSRYVRTRKALLRMIGRSS